jgi:tetratricopeptide (TPR) repeat protein
MSTAIGELSVRISCQQSPRLDRVLVRCILGKASNHLVCLLKFAVTMASGPVSGEPFMKRFFSICLSTAMAALPAFGAGSGSAGSSDEPVAKQESPAVAAYNQGVELMKSKRFAQAESKFEEAVKLDPNFAEAYNNLAFTLRKQGSANFEKSLAFYNKAIQLKPKLAEAYMYRGVLYTQMGRKADAQADLALLKKLNRSLAKELEEFMQTGKEEDYLYGATKKK